MAMQLTERQADVVRLREDEGLSWSAVGERLGISKSTLFRLLREDALPSYRLTDKGSLRFKESEIDVWLKRRTND